MARQKLIEHNLRLVLNQVSYFKKKNPRVPMEDLFGEAVAGLIKAVDEFDDERAGKMSTPAVRFIRSNLLRRVVYPDYMGEGLRLPECQARRLTDVRRAEAEIADEQNMSIRRVSDKQIADRTGVSEENVGFIRQAAIKIKSLDDPVFAGGTEGSAGMTSLADEIPSHGPTVEEWMDGQIAREEALRRVDGMMMGLDLKQQKIIAWRYDLEGWADRLGVLRDNLSSEAEMARYLGITVGMMRGLEKQALRKMTRSGK